MDTSFYKDFKPADKEDWLERINADLKDRTTDDLMIQLTEEWEISPFQTSEDLEFTTQINKYFEHCHLAESFDAEDGNLEEKVMEALSFGLEVPVISNFSHVGDLFSRLEKVNWDMVHPVWITGQNADMEALKEYLDPTQIFFVKSSSPSDQLLQFPNAKTVHFHLESSSPAHFPEQLSQWLLEVVELLDSIKEENIRSVMHHCWLSVDQGPEFPFEIARLRALRLLWSFLLEQYAVDEADAIPIMAELGNGVDQKDPYKNMVSFSSAGLYAMMGGADMLLTSPLGGGSKDLSESFQRRISRNINHIARMESHIDKVYDPVSGSYVLEMISQSLCQLSWKKFHEKMGNPTDKKSG